MQELKKPINQLSEVLFYLITKKYITFSQIHQETGIINLSARLSDLKISHNLPIKLNNVKTTNKFGRKIEFGSWCLQDKIKGIEIYNEIINK